MRGSRKGSSNELFPSTISQWVIHCRYHPEQSKPLAIPVPLSSLDQDSPSRISAESILSLLQDDLLEPSITMKQVRVFNSKAGGYLRLNPDFWLDLSSLRGLNIEVILEKENAFCGFKLESQQSEIISSLIFRIEELEGSVSKMKSAIRDLLGGSPSNQMDSNFSESMICEDPFLRTEPDSSKLPEHGHLSMNSGTVIQKPMLRHTISSNYTNNRDITVFKEFTLESIPKQTTPQLHFAILYSNPLVEIETKLDGRKKVIHLPNDPVNFSEECSNILKSLKKHEKKINVRIECATQDEFLGIIRKHPTVLHVMCHGSYDIVKQEHYLEFENEDCELLRLSPAKLRLLLHRDDLSSIRVVFINACHSEVISV